MNHDLARRLAAEAFGTFFLVMAVIGSGIMAETLADGNVALALLCNTLATAAILVVIITIFVSVSGAQFNPAVTLVMRLRGEIDDRTALLYVATQIVAGLLGAVAAHLMFGLSPSRFRPVPRRIHRHVRANCDHSRLPPLQAGRACRSRRSLYWLCLLVHLVNFLRQPGGDHRARVH
jgi:glycerol uptake facilitator-like aquaporin